MRLALMIAAAGATGKFGAAPRELLQQGVKRLAASPELSKITDSVRGELLDAARSAAVTAASSRIDSLNDRLQDRITNPVRGTRGQDENGEQPADDDYIDADEEPVDDSVESDNGEVSEVSDEPEADEEPEPPRRRNAPATRSTQSRSSRSRATTQARSASGRAPVRRTGR
ncbi:hypothetical protein [Prauserella cavernicola]|nr:hypothetical protein [Prauserella cavernicola]